jgi:large subunit ribosomal protein L17
MRHGKKIPKLGCNHSQRKAMLANMVTSLFDNEVIKTTSARAKALRRTADHMITFAKRGDLHARRQVLRLIANKRVVGKLFDEIGPRYKTRNGGYTRIVKLGPRRGDAAFMCILELVDRPGAEVEVAPVEEEAVAEATT